LFERLDNKIASAQSQFPNAPAEQWQKMSEETALGKGLLARVAGLTDQRELNAKRDSLKEAYVAVIKSLKAITGQDEKDAPEGGQ
jgi:hypothetical protein